MATENSTPSKKKEKKRNTVFVPILNFCRQKEKKHNLSAMQKPREPALCLRLWNQSRAISCGNQFRFQSLAIGTSPVPVPWNRNQSLCYSALLFLLLLRLLRLLLVGVCQILTLHMFLYQQLLFLCPTSLPGVVELVFTVFGCVVSTSFCCCCCCSLLFVE